MALSREAMQVVSVKHQRYPSLNKKIATHLLRILDQQVIVVEDSASQVEQYM